MNEFFEFFYESDQEWMTLEDYCLERDLLLDQTQLIVQIAFMPQVLGGL